jgi:hypothetical protein
MDIAGMKIMTRVRFSKLVEDLLVRSRGDISYVDAILEIADRCGIDPSDVNKLLSKPLIEKVTAEAQRARLLKIPSLNTLPV